MTYVAKIFQTRCKNRLSNFTPCWYKVCSQAMHKCIGSLGGYLLYLMRIVWFFCSHSIIVKCTDDGVPYKSLEKVLTININDVNEAPTGIHLSSNRVRENYPSVTVGRLVVSDPDQKGQTFTMRLTDKSLPFKVAGDVLITTQSLNYERKSVYKISVRATDQGGE